ncbi:ATP-binding protein [Cupriavidus sp. DL-D2]|uniref:ATP-binding protein n=1 Tax=Cupriavidus sp. DL-D2 TaxID=3144974 RepID=UPI0032123D88
MAKHILHTQQRAFTWTGPYGGGKSSLALTVASLAAGDPKLRRVAKDALGLDQGSALGKIFATRNPWVVLPLVGKRASIVDEIGREIDSKLPTRGPKPKNQGERDVIAELQRAAENRTDIGGVLLIIDELGKFLEHTSSAGGDVGFFQDLAEAASRTKGNLVVVGILHQSFEQYAQRLGKTARDDWAKVQGRFVDIPLVAGNDEVVSLIGRALDVRVKHPSSAQIADRIGKVIQKRRPSTSSDIGVLLDKCWPLHPVTAALLGPASRRRFGQNERSVFGFLGSAENLGFLDVLGGMKGAVNSYYWPAQFWDYLRSNFEAAILSSPDGHRWAAGAEAVDRAEARFSSLHLSLVKTISLIELLRNGSGLAAEDRLLECSVEASSSAVRSALSELASASILIYRKHLDAWGIYAGSDFDIDGAIREARSRLGERPLNELLGELVSLAPVTARRHYWATGAMRWFSRRILRHGEARQYIKEFSPAPNQCGEFLLVLPARDDDDSARKRHARQFSKAAEGSGMLIGTPSNGERIEELIQELEAIEHVKSHRRELHGDSVAVREISARIASLRGALSEEIRDAFNAASWYLDGALCKRDAAEGLPKLASDLADQTFTSAPHIFSELVNRDALSSSAAKAQRELLHSMLSKVDQPLLGYDSFSADAGLYHTVLRSSGVHRAVDGRWQFASPSGTPRSASVQPLWKRLNDVVFRGKQDSVNLQEIYEDLSQPPYGVKKGVMPIFALAFFLANRSRLALYIDGVFTPEVVDAHVDEWLQDPTRIDWRIVRIEANEKEMLRLLATALARKLGKPVADDVLDTARALVALVYQLPHWTRRTNSLSKDALEVRKLLLHASDPHKVIFADLPLILKTAAAAPIAEKVATTVEELLDAYPIRLRAVEERLLSALDHEGELGTLNGRARTVAGVGADLKLDAFAIRLEQFNGQLPDVEGLLMLAIGRPARDWSDHDIDAGEIQLLSWAMEFRRVETLAFVRNRPVSRRAFAVIFGGSGTVSGTFDVADADVDRIEKLKRHILTDAAKSGVKAHVYLAALAEAGAAIYTDLVEVKGEKIG